MFQIPEEWNGGFGMQVKNMLRKRLLTCNTPWGSEMLESRHNLFVQSKTLPFYTLGKDHDAGHRTDSSDLSTDQRMPLA